MDESSREVLVVTVASVGRVHILDAPRPTPVTLCGVRPHRGTWSHARPWRPPQAMPIGICAACWDLLQVQRATA